MKTHIITLLAALPLAGLLWGAPSAFAHENDWRHERFHDKLQDVHKRQHHQLRDLHEQFHEYPHSRQEHRQFHRWLNRDHRTAHRTLSNWLKKHRHHDDHQDWRSVSPDDPYDWRRHYRYGSRGY